MINSAKNRIRSYCKNDLFIILFSLLILTFPILLITTYLFPEKWGGYLVFSNSFPAPQIESYQGGYLEVFCGGDFDLCGYRDKNTKNIVIQPQFEKALKFVEGLAPVKFDGQWGFIDINGHFVIQPQFERVGNFYQGLAEVVLNGRSGIVDNTGRIVLNPQFFRAIPLTHDTIIINDQKKQSYKHSNANEILTNLKDLSYFDENIQYRFFSLKSNQLSEASWFLQIFDRKGSGRIWARQEWAGLFGLLKSDGSWQIEPRFQRVQEIKYNKIYVYEDGAQLASHIDENGNVTEKYAISEKNTNSKLVMVVPATISSPTSTKEIAIFFNGTRLIQHNSKIYVTNASIWVRFGYLTRCIINFECERPFHSLVHFVPDQYALLYREDIETSNLYYLYPNGSIRRVSNSEEAEMNEFLTNRYYEEKEFQVKIDHNGPYIRDKKRNITLASGSYKSIYQYNKANIFEATFKNPNKEAIWIDPYGNTIPEFPKNLDERKDLLNCEGGSTNFFSDSSSGVPRWGIINKDGKVLIEPIYRAVSCFKRGYAWAADDVKHQWCPIGPNTKEKNHPKCVDEMNPILTDLVAEKFSNDPYESSVLWVQAFLEHVSGFREKAPKKYRGIFNRDTLKEDLRPYTLIIKNN